MSDTNGEIVIQLPRDRTVKLRRLTGLDWEHIYRVPGYEDNATSPAVILAIVRVVLHRASVEPKYWAPEDPNARRPPGRVDVDLTQGEFAIVYKALKEIESADMEDVSPFLGIPNGSSPST